MRRRWHYYGLLSILIFSITIQFLYLFLWGIHTIPGADIFSYLIRAKGAVVGDSHIFTHPGPSTKMDIYPPGFRITVANFMFLSGTTDPYITYFILLGIQAVMTPLAIFLITVKISRKFALITSFFSTVVFGFVSNPMVDYTYMKPTINILSNSIQSRFLMIIMIVIIIKILTSTRYHIKSTLLLIVVLTTLGLSHISPFIGFSVGLGVVLLMLAIAAVFRRRFRNIHYFKDTLALVIPIIVSAILVFVLYYSRVIREQLRENMIPEYIRPVYNSPLIQNMVFFFMIFLTGLLLYTLYLPTKRLSHSLFRRLPMWGNYVMVLTLIGYHLFLVAFITFTKRSPIGAREVISGLYPMYISLNLQNFKVIPFQIIGWFFFAVSIVGFYGLISSRHDYTRFIGYLFFVSLIFSYLIIYPLSNSIYYDLYLTSLFYPVTLSTGFIVLYHAITKNPEYSTRTAFVFHEGIELVNSIIKRIAPLKRARAIIYLRYAASGLIVLVFVFSNVMYSINNPPSLREMQKIDNPLYIYEKEKNPIYTYNTIVYVNWNTKNGEYIASGYQDSSALYVTTHIKASSFGYYDQDSKKHYGAELGAALSNPEKLGEYVGTYHVRYIVVGNYTLKPWHDAIESNPELIKIYEGPHGEQIYVYGVERW